ncbi:MAG: right-handed parallel beta-helix repeat-containing protein [Planctomycetes bacterium]|nr:right-handed parallel beta-helix repeat-containing protein [Planctomycetota bacterium]
MLRSILFALVATAFSGSAPRATFFVAPGGRDENPGTEAAPFRTIERARDAVRAIPREARGEVSVILRGGVYAIDRTIAFTPDDSGEDGRPIIVRAADGETPIVSGGRRITGWEPDVGGRWKAPSPIDDFRQLYVDGKRAVRARGDAPAGIALEGDDGYRIPSPAMSAWRNPQDIEFCYLVVWTHSRCKVAGLRRDGDSTIATMLQPGFRLARKKEGVRVDLPAYVENAFELLDEPGEWYLDRPARTVYYIPRPGEDPRRSEFIAPAVERLVALEGTLDRPVHDILFTGIAFEHSTWLGPSRFGHPDVQANFLPDVEKPLERGGTITTVHNENLKSPSAILCRTAHGIRFEGCTFTRLGGGGIDIERGSRGNAIIGCRFTDIAGTAIQVGDVGRDDHHPSDPRLVVKDNRIENNLIRDVAVEYKGGVGIFAGYTDGTVIAHNEIAGLPYSGISIGWGWGEEDAGGGADHYSHPFRYDTPTPARDNRCEYNHIHHVMQELQDGGAIYTLSRQPGTIIRGNEIHDNPGSPGGIYLDEGSADIEITGNVVWNVPNPMNYNNHVQGRKATCREHDDFFGLDPAGAARIPDEAQAILERAGLEPEYRRRLLDEAR